jgi:ABC-type antimicrobial peptide transport system permease subunit
VLTDTIDKTFNDLFNQVTKGVDVAVRAKATVSSQANQQRAPMAASVPDQVKAVQGVKAAEGSVQGYAQFVGKNGKAVTTGGAPTVGVSLSSTPELQAAATVRDGRRPSGPGEVAVDAHTASKQRFHVGDRVKLLFQGPPGEYTVVGILGFGQADNLAGATPAGFDLATAQRVLHREGVYDEVDAVAAPGVTDSELRDRVKAALDPKYEALTGRQLAEDTAKAFGQFTKFINYALLAFAFVALFVGSFIIFNTFSIVLAQRTRELALLRCLGASRCQLLGSVLTEALIVGVLASVVGLGFGLLVATGLKQVFKAVGADLPSTTLEILPRTIVVALLVGVGVTLVASLVPALKATRVPPVAALQQEAVAAPARTSRRCTMIGTLVTAAGVALLLAGLFAKQGNRLLNVASGGVAIRKDVAKQHGWKVGDTVAMEFPIGGTQPEPIKAIYEDNQLNGGYLLALADYQRHYLDQVDQVALVKAKPGVSPDASRAAVDGVVKDFPVVQVKDQAEHKNEQSSQINRVLVLFYVLLALAVVIAVIGIINTLALSVLERVRELGLLRAVGMTRGQLRQMIRWEAVIIAVLGAVLGLVVGTFFGWTLVRALHSQGITEFALPLARSSSSWSRPPSRACWRRCSRAAAPPGSTCCARSPPSSAPACVDSAAAPAPQAKAHRCARTEHADEERGACLGWQRRRAQRDRGEQRPGDPSDGHEDHRARKAELQVDQRLATAAHRAALPRDDRSRQMRPAVGALACGDAGRRRGPADRRSPVGARVTGPRCRRRPRSPGCRSGRRRRPARHTRAAPCRPDRRSAPAKGGAPRAGRRGRPPASPRPSGTLRAARRGGPGGRAPRRTAPARRRGGEAPSSRRRRRE